MLIKSLLLSQYLLYMPRLNSECKSSILRDNPTHFKETRRQEEIYQPFISFLIWNFFKPILERFVGICNTQHWWSPEEQKTAACGPYFLINIRSLNAMP